MVLIRQMIPCFLFMNLENPPQRLKSLLGWIPKVDISEKRDNVKIRLNVPGVNPDNIEVEVGDSLITVSGQMEKEVEERGETWHRIEREKGTFRRIIPLPFEVHRDSLKAESRHGILTLFLKKKAFKQREKIKLKDLNL